MSLVDEYIERSRLAQSILATLSQTQVDSICRMIGKVVYDNAEMFATETVAETRMGNVPDKISKCLSKSRIIWNAIKSKPSRGIIARVPTKGIIEIAKPMGIVGAVTPTTNPIVTPMCNAMYAIKGGNTIIVAPHPRAKNVNLKLAKMIRAELVNMGYPEDIYQTFPEPSVELTNELISEVDVVIATGGMGMVKAAYSSGKPSFGVGAGNVQVLLDRGIDFTEAIAKIIKGRCYDNGVICAAEQSIIVHEDDKQAVLSAFAQNGGYYIDDKSTIDSAMNKLFPNGVISKDVVGQEVKIVAKIAEIEVPNDTKCLMFEGVNESLRKEKMFPLLALYTYKTWDEAIDIAKQNLLIEGTGHSASVHSFDSHKIEQVGTILPVSRVVVNQISATSVGGSFINGLNPTTTIGCGSWGNNSISENLFYKHLFNISRIAYAFPGEYHRPTDEQIWSDIVTSID